LMTSMTKLKTLEITNILEKGENEICQTLHIQIKETLKLTANALRLTFSESKMKIGRQQAATLEQLL